MLQIALTGDQAMLDAPSALVLRVENIYEQDGNYFAVDVNADWSATDLCVSVRDKPSLNPKCCVAAFVAHVSGGEVETRQRMRSGHYTAFVRQLPGDIWFVLDSVTLEVGCPAVTQPPCPQDSL